MVSPPVPDAALAVEPPASRAALLAWEPVSEPAWEPLQARAWRVAAAPPVFLPEASAGSV